jgi:ribosomal protein S6
MNTYEALYIITTKSQDENIPEIITQLENELKSHSCKIETVQKLEKRQFERPTKKIDSGYYVNIRFKAKPDTISTLKNRLKFNTAIYRQFYIKRPEKAAA